jgi:hypothetical protein
MVILGSMPTKPISIRGKTFSSLREAASHFGAHYGNAVRRLNSGWSVEQALGLEPHVIKRPSKGTPVITSSGDFASITDAAEHFGIPRAVLNARLENGWPPDEAVGLIPHRRRQKKNNPVMCEGKTYPNHWALAEAYGKKGPLVAKRLRHGWTPEQAVEIAEPPPRYRDRHGKARATVWREVETLGDTQYPATHLGEYKLYLITNQVNGKVYVGITINPLWQRFNGHKAAAKKGLKTKLYNAIRHYGEENFTVQLLRSDAHSFSELQEQEIAEIAARGTIERGYNVSPGGSVGTPASVKVGDMVFPSRGAAAEYFGVSVAAFNLRLSRLGWTPEQAAEIEPREKHARRRFVVEGKTYNSLNQVAEAYGFDYKLLWSRVRSRGWSLEQALELSSPPESAKARGIPVIAFGKEYPSLEACAKANGVEAGSLWQRVSRYGQSPEDAIRYLQSPESRRRGKSKTQLPG